MSHRSGAALLLAAALAACATRAHASPPIAIPGTGLSLGMRMTRVDSLVAFRGRAPSPTQRTGTSRFFGMDANTTLDFDSGRLKHAHFEVSDVSTHSRDYAEDQLRRLGLKPGCSSWDMDRHDCEWNGDCVIHLVWAPGKLNADATPPPGWTAIDTTAAPPSQPVAATPLGSTPPAALPAALAPAAPVVSTSGSGPGPDAHPALNATSGPASGATAGLAMLPDTLFIGWPNDIGGMHRARTIVPPQPPAYPVSAKNAGVQGIVRLIATVDARGYVTGTDLVHGISELNHAAVNATKACRFVPLGPPGFPQGFRVLVQVRFTLS
jgi:TonB family protein